MKRDVFTLEELHDCGVFDLTVQCSVAAHYLSLYRRGTVTRQNVEYWRYKASGGKRKVKAKGGTKPLKIIVVADTQCKPGESLDYMTWIGRYIADKKPDVVVHIGDNWDFPSLSSYDKGKASFEGRRLKADIQAGNDGLINLTAAAVAQGHKPRLVFCMGNHEERLDRLVQNTPELQGFTGTDHLPVEELGWERVPFLEPAYIAGIAFVHYLANGFTGKPYGGSALNILQKVGHSFVVGHKQCLDIALRPILNDRMQIGIVNGACYPHDEAYKGAQGNNHFRGLIVLNEAQDGFALPMPVSLNYLEKRYGHL